MPQDASPAPRTDTARLHLLESAAVRIGTSLDLFRTAEELAQVAVSGLADVAVVELLDSVLHGEAPAPGPVSGQSTVRRAAAAAAGRSAAPSVHDVGDAWVLRFGSPYAQALGDLRPRLVRKLDPDDTWLRRDPERARVAQAEAAHSMIAVPLTVRGVALGMVSLYRLGTSAAFDDPDVAEAAGLAAHAAACLDNARRHTREKALARLVQRTLVPRRLPAHVAAETAWTYLPVAASGSWFDVVTLSGARIACVVGEVDGQGMAAVSLMGQISTAIAALAAVDLGPDEILSRVHDLTVETAMERPALATDPARLESLTAGCVLAVYDPVSGTCTVARAGHPAPTVVSPDGSTTVIDAPAGPALGGAGEPRFPLTTVPIAAGSVLALHTAGLPDILAPALTSALNSGEGLQAACDGVLAQAFPDGPKDDTLLVLNRTRVLGADRTRSWTLHNRPESAAEARRLAARQLADWGMEELAFTAELLVSELVTNSVRYSTGQIDLRLIVRENTLACEVTDANSAAPRMRRSQDDDEGGRGLFLIAQFALDWGVRSQPRGKTIWAELPLSGAPGDDVDR
ncbi:serine/threonine-protein phosphatase [Streptomycetaceae bacterium NBC_01309]